MSTGRLILACIFAALLLVPANVFSQGPNVVVNIEAGSLDADSGKSYSPSELTVGAGTTVTWVNSDSTGHTVTSGIAGSPDIGSVFDSGFPLIKPNSTFSHRFDNVGEFPYFCQVHPWMRGNVTVIAAQIVEGGEPTGMEGEGTEGTENNNVNATATIPVKYNLTIQKVVPDQIKSPAQLGFAPDGRIFFAQKSGKVGIIANGRVLPDPFATLEVEPGPGQGLLGLVLHPDFKSKPYVYLYYTYNDTQKNTYNRIARMTDVNSQGTEMQVILDKLEADKMNNGGYMKFGPDGKLYVITGSVLDRAVSQDLQSLNGKILRINDDGSVPDDNPFPGSLVYTYGHRDGFGFDWHPLTGDMFETENGPDTDDEVNIIRSGNNYGWPEIVGAGKKGGYTDPIITYTPTIAITGAVFYTGDRYPQDKYALFVGDYKNGNLHRIVLSPPDYTKVLSETTIELGVPITDLTIGPDGYLWFTSVDSIYRIVDIYWDLQTILDLKVERNVSDLRLLELDANLTDSMGRDVSDAAVNFYSQDGLVGVRRTNMSGMAVMAYKPTNVGSYTFYANYTGEGRFGSSASAERQINIEEIPSHISLAVSKVASSATVAYEVRGTMDPPEDNVKVKLTYIDPNGTAVVERFAAVSKGSFNDIFVPQGNGRWTANAVYDDGSIYATASAQFDVNIRTAILSISSVKVTDDQKVQVMGSISPPMADKYVKLEYTKAGNITETRYAVTYSDGTFNDEFKTDIAGTWSVTSSAQLDRNIVVQSKPVSFDVQGKNCIIATTSFGSDLAPEVQLLRGFRERVVSSTMAGSNFMVAFNSFYYSFSPQVAHTIAGVEEAKSIVRIMIIPLLKILEVSTMVYDLINYSAAGSEVAILTTGFTASMLIGLVYMAPPLILIGIMKKNMLEVLFTRRALSTISIIAAFSLGILALGLAIEVAPLLLVSSSLFVLSTISLTSVGVVRFYLMVRTMLPSMIPKRPEK